MHPTCMTSIVGITLFSHYVMLHDMTRSESYLTVHYITLHYTTLHYTTLHYTTLHYITLHYITLHYITLHYITLHYITLHYIILHYITLHYITLHCIALQYITLSYLTLPYITLHYIIIQYRKEQNTLQNRTEQNKTAQLLNQKTRIYNVITDQAVECLPLEVKWKSACRCFCTWSGLWPWGICLSRQPFFSVSFYKKCSLRNRPGDWISLKISPSTLEQGRGWVTPRGDPLVWSSNSPSSTVSSSQKRPSLRLLSTDWVSFAISSASFEQRNKR